VAKKNCNGRNMLRLLNRRCKQLIQMRQMWYCRFCPPGLTPELQLSKMSADITGCRPVASLPPLIFQTTVYCKVAGLIPDDVIGIFHWYNPFGRTMALGSTQPLTEMSTRNISWGKGGWCVGLTTLPPPCADCLEIWEPHPSGTLRVCPDL
jgi:hypothetical protein